MKKYVYILLLITPSLQPLSLRYIKKYAIWAGFTALGSSLVIFTAQFKHVRPILRQKLFPNYIESHERLLSQVNQLQIENQNLTNHLLATQSEQHFLHHRLNIKKVHHEMTTKNLHHMIAELTRAAQAQSDQLHRLQTTITQLEEYLLKANQPNNNAQSPTMTDDTISQLIESLEIESKSLQ
jgi:folate-binding Fe-S cluster repair protein YgfZ